MFIAYLSSIALLLGLLSHSSAFEKRAFSSASTTSCISDNCLNAVSSAHFTGSADCSRYELAVATPSTSSTYTVITVTVTGIETIWVPTISYVVWELASTTTPAVFTPPPAVTVEEHNPTLTVKRDIVPRTTSATIPSYASACYSSTAYASACSCIGVNVTPPPVISVFTTTVTKTIPTSTTTSIATFTREVCAPDNDYGFIYSNDFGMYTNNPNITACPNPAGGCSILAEFTMFTLDRHDCCAGCYTGINGCYFYWMDLENSDGTCKWAILNTEGSPSTEWEFNVGGNLTLTPDSPHCPNGNTWVTTKSPGNTLGVGPCVQRWLDDAY